MGVKTQEMKDIIESKENKIAVQARAGCVDSETEYFNGIEWKKITDYLPNEKVLQFESKWSSSLVVPSNYIKEPCREFYKVKTESLDMLLSEEHRVIYVSKEAKREGSLTSQSFRAFKLREKPMKEVYENHITSKIGFYGRIPTVFSGFTGRKKKQIPLLRSQLMLCTIVTSSLGFDCGEIVTLKLNNKNREDILEKLLKTLDISYTRIKKLYSANTYTYTFEFKELRFFKPSCLINLTKNEKKLILDTLEKYRGSRDKNNNLRMYLKDKKFIDFIQLLAHSSRIRCTFSKCKKESPYYLLIFSSNRIYFGFTNKDTECKNSMMTKVTNDEGYKYCFTVPSGMLILRRNGIIFVTGNSGKSSTLVEYIKAHPKENILFLVYNKEMQKDFSLRVRGVRNCEVKTIHSLAYRWYIQHYGKKKFKNVSVVDIRSILRNKSLEFAELSTILKYFNEFLCSDVEKASDLIEHNMGDKIYFKYVQKLWKHFSSKMPEYITHNCYLKLFQLSKPKLNYDTLLVDETNDVNSCMLDIVINNLDKKVIVVGDSLQNLNSFNYTIDGLAIMRDKYNFKEYPLTQSFRVSETVANIASRYLSFMYDKPIKFTGVNDTKIGKLYLRDAEVNNKINLLCRTRLGALQEILTMLEQGIEKKVYFVGGLDSFGIKTLEKLIQFHGYLYISGEKFHISELRSWIKGGLEDSEIESKVNLYNFYTKNKDCIDQLRGCETTKKEDSEIIVQTAHSSKGATMKNVKLARDFNSIEDLKADKQFLEQKVYDEKKPMYAYRMRMRYSDINLVYVALTRATGIVDIGQTLNKKDKRDDTKEESNIKSMSKLDRIKAIQDRIKKVKNHTTEGG